MSCREQHCGSHDRKLSARCRVESSATGHMTGSSVLGVGVVLQGLHGSSPQRSAAELLGAAAGVCVCAAAVSAAVSAQDRGA